MAKTQITDDIDGSKDAREVSFAFQGTNYNIDLGKKNLAAFEKASKPYIDAATKVSRGPAKTRRSTKSRFSGGSDAAVREWAREAGIEVSQRGRIPKAVLEQYESAHKE